jgi:REP element-mobilizing transposase RayT
MNNNLQRPHRRSVRLTGYDYSQAGAYFITTCVQDRMLLFGEVVDGEMRLNEYGEIVRREWERTGKIRQDVGIDAFVIMPNHFHGIIVIDPGRGTLQRAPTTERFGKPTSNTIPTIARLFKSTTTRQINEHRGTPSIAVWQRNYYEHMVRSEKSLNRIRQYIADNPLQWAMDRENPNAVAACRGTLPRAPWRI